MEKQGPAETPDQHLETMLVGKDLRNKLNAQLQQMVVDYGQESLKEKPDELLMKSLEEQMNEIGARLASSDGTESETEPQPGFISDQQRRPGTVGSVKLPGRWRKEQDPQVQSVEGDGGDAVDAPEIVEPTPTPEPTTQILNENPAA